MFKQLIFRNFTFKEAFRKPSLFFDSLARQQINVIFLVAVALEIARLYLNFIDERTKTEIDFTQTINPAAL